MSTPCHGWVRDGHGINGTIAIPAATFGVACEGSDPSAGAGPVVTFHRKPKPLPDGAVTSDWPAFLGPRHDAVCPETKLLKEWPVGGPVLVWEMETGEGYASPVVVGDRLVYFHRVGDRETVDCVKAETGQHLWRFEYPSKYKDRYGFNGGPRASPVIDGGRVYTFGAEGMLHCLDLATGSEIWKLDATERFKIPPHYFGVGSTPLVEGDLLIVQVGGAEGPCVAAFNKTDGKIAWTAGRWRASYASPVPAVVHGQQRVLVFAGGDIRPPTGGLLVIDPADGRIHTRFGFRSERYVSVNAVNPVIVDDRVFLSSSYHTGSVQLRLMPDDSHQVTWKTDGFGAHFATPIYHAGHLYGIDGSSKRDAALVCLDWKTGQEVWRQAPKWIETVDKNGKKEPVELSMFMGALILADGHFLILGELGHLAWADLTPQGYREIVRTRLFDAGETWCPLVVSRGLLYVCQNRPDNTTQKPPRLLCYDLRAGR
ncbi:MAG: PQQ-like beta-propeller repeat protein [Planctomycetes bacterium]|nr:PQQ-like beta-propeller repeat protein [Planctomycetota bacterium]